MGVPAGWQVQQQGQGIAAMDQQTGASMMCMVTPKQAQSLQQFVQMFVDNFKRSVQGWRQIGQETIQVSGNPAMHIRATGQPQGATMAADYVFVLTGQNQCLLLMSCPQQQATQVQGIFQQIMQSWQVR